ncbi:uncharacterized protein NMK_1672 [Novimethylophilus kurashikiensis]|uniref:DUF1841 domain-containing protein n=1 Tax=Novimethylophilus kurashikiensis TaxID=1825523 RepID=A0A2R5F797_9PROT|nr:DUF1841 family protein [Novimethylophilus kurashikiensis]GBG14112.1 uncharacterized protein NMK_1672 [Novimethylophilus kurashikiensis]
MALFNPSRDEVRQFFFEAWRKYRVSEPLTALEGMAVEVIALHPEYHAVLDAPDRYRDQDYFPEMGETNPFLHMSLHLSILEQLSIDQPPGIAAAYRALQQRLDDQHEALHGLMECLAETVWRAQRDKTPPDAGAYLECMRKRAAE